MLLIISLLKSESKILQSTYNIEARVAFLALHLYKYYTELYGVVPRGIQKMDILQVVLMSTPKCPIKQITHRIRKLAWVPSNSHVSQQTVSMATAAADDGANRPTPPIDLEGTGIDNTHTRPLCQANDVLTLPTSQRPRRKAV